MRFVRVFIVVLGVLAISACVHSGTRGTVVMKVGKDRAHVCLGDKEVKVGDRIALYRTICTDTGGRIGTAGEDAGSQNIDCRKDRIGGGTVTNLLNSHYSTVKVDADVEYKEGTLVEAL